MSQLRASLAAPSRPHFQAVVGDQVNRSLEVAVDPCEIDILALSEGPPGHDGQPAKAILVANVDPEIALQDLPLDARSDRVASRNNHAGAFRGSR